MVCCGRNNGACVCAQEATCSCGKQPALQCSTYTHIDLTPASADMHAACEKAATENKLPESTCACGKRAEGKHAIWTWVLEPI